MRSSMLLFIATRLENSDVIFISLSIYMYKDFED